LLEKYTRGRVSGELRSDLETKRADELAKMAAYELEKDKEKKLDEQIQQCIILAPIDGLLVYAQDIRPNRPDVGFQIEEGATVRERQKIFSAIESGSPMRVNTKVHESLVTKIALGQPAKIRVDAFANLELTGKVQRVNPLPDPNRAFSGSNTKAFTTLVAIDKRVPGLRPGLSAQVEILAELENVLSVPVSDVLRFDDRNLVAVKKPDGGLDWREVTLGISNGERVEIKKGVEDGESVVQLSQVQKRKKVLELSTSR
jgi:HlyD family secretion protein